MERLRAAWPAVVDLLGASHPVLRTDLLDSIPESLTDTCCTIGFDPEFSGEIDEVKRLGVATLQRAVSSELKRQVKIDFCKASGPVRWSHERKQSAASSGAPTANLRSWEKNPAIRQVLEIFHGDVRDVQS